MNGKPGSVVFGGGGNVVDDPPRFVVMAPRELPDAKGRLSWVFQAGGAELTARLTPSEMKQVARGILAMAEAAAGRNQ